MFSQVFSLLAVLYFAKSDTKIKGGGQNMVGLNTLHDNGINQIDKDTIITRNMNTLKITKRGKSSDKTEEKLPDWSYSSFPDEVKDHVANFKRNMSDCLKEVQASDKRPVKRLSPNKESPVHGECLIACVLKRNGVIEHGKVNKGNLLTLVRKFYAKNDKMIKKLEKNLDRCIEFSAQSKDECTVAARLNECTNGLMAHNKQKITVNY